MRLTAVQGLANTGLRANQRGQRVAISDSVERSFEPNSSARISKEKTPTVCAALRRRGE